jgi:hypothetical protein
LLSGEELPGHMQRQYQRHGRVYEGDLDRDHARGRALPGLRISDVSADAMREGGSRRGGGNGNADAVLSAQMSPRYLEHDRDRDRDVSRERGRDVSRERERSRDARGYPYAGSPYSPPPPNGRSPYIAHGHGHGHPHTPHGNGNGMGAVNGFGHGHGRVSSQEKNPQQLSPLPYPGSGSVGGLSPVGGGNAPMGASTAAGGTSPSAMTVSLSGGGVGPVPIRPASDAQATQRKRQSANGNKSGGTRASSNYGPKVVACNFCRGGFCVSLLFFSCVFFCVSSSVVSVFLLTLLILGFSS